MTASELLGFARLHLSGGTTADGTRLLSEESARAMLEPQVEVPDPWTLGSHWGLGWILTEWSGQQIYGHDGATLGQGGFLRIHPGSELSVSLLCNGGRMRELFQDVYTEVFAELAQVEMPPALEPPASPPEFDPAAYTGRYTRESVELEVAQGEHGLTPTTRNTSALAAAMDAEPQVLSLTPYETDVFLAKLPEEDSLLPAVFFSLDDGSRCLHLGARSTPRTG
jgi:hypothetical protein